MTWTSPTGHTYTDPPRQVTIPGTWSSYYTGDPIQYLGDETDSAAAVDPVTGAESDPGSARTVDPAAGSDTDPETVGTAQTATD